MSNSVNETVMSNLFTFESLVQFPLASIIESSASGNTTTLDFLNQYCFEMVEGKRVARTFTFYYDYVKGGAAQTMRVEIPIISLITIPYYTIDSATFEMGVNVISWVENIDKTANGDNAPPPKLLAMLGPYDATTTKASTQSIESLQYSKVNTNMKVKMEVVSSDLPAGIMQLINVSSQGVAGNIAYDLKITPSRSELIMKKNEEFLTLTLEQNSDDDDDDDVKATGKVAGVTLIITVKSSVSGVDPSKEFNEDISTKGNIVGTSSIEQIKVLTDANGAVKIAFHPSLKTSTNGFVTISSPLTFETKIYYRIDNA